VREPSGWLDATTFESVVASTPLISIDLLVENVRGEYLLGLRKNRPAQGHWFVPGGRVQKNESLDAAFKRLTRQELGVEWKRSQAIFKGVYEHFYNDSVFGVKPTTHYIVLAYHIKVLQLKITTCAEQHCNSRWLSPVLMKALKIHRYTQDYFESYHEMIVTLPPAL